MTFLCCTICFQTKRRQRQTTYSIHSIPGKTMRRRAGTNEWMKLFRFLSSAWNQSTVCLFIVIFEFSGLFLFIEWLRETYAHLYYLLLRYRQADCQAACVSRWHSQRWLLMVYSMWPKWWDGGLKCPIPYMTNILGIFDAPCCLRGLIQYTNRKTSADYREPNSGKWSGENKTRQLRWIRHKFLKIMKIILFLSLFFAKIMIIHAFSVFSFAVIKEKEILFKFSI